jgi:hypothetical protein
MARTLKSSLRSARDFQPIDRMMYAGGRMLAMYLTCEQCSRFSELAPKALNIFYAVCRDTYPC